MNTEEDLIMEFIDTIKQLSQRIATLKDSFSCVTGYINGKDWE